MATMIFIFSAGPKVHERSLENHAAPVIPAKAGIHFLVLTWTPASAGVTMTMDFISTGGPQAMAALGCWPTFQCPLPQKPQT
jgi:hypothetical protein